MSLDDVASQTRIPMRHLQHIEREEWDALPAPTYAIGFTRNYANAVGLDGPADRHELRDEIGGPRRRARRAEYYEPADPARVPPKSLRHRASSSRSSCWSAPICSGATRSAPTRVPRRSRSPKPRRTAAGRRRTAGRSPAGRCRPDRDPDRDRRRLAADHRRARAARSSLMGSMTAGQTATSCRRPPRPMLRTAIRNCSRQRRRPRLGLIGADGVPSTSAAARSRRPRCRPGRRTGCAPERHLRCARAERRPRRPTPAPAQPPAPPPAAPLSVPPPRRSNSSPSLKAGDSMRSSNIMPAST